ncbi:MAG: ATP-dependent Clp protease ATP-binding subunit, partial [Anaerolineae bacterium]|nr:ATP-dependent Clp protease ATP-binding subunit [Anaerolineae bacterium]
MMRLDRFTERAQDAAQRAVEVMARYSHTQVDTEHILLALLEQPESAVVQIMQLLGVDLESIKIRLDETLKDSPKVGIYGGGGIGQVFITPRVKRVLDQANDEANKLKDDYISTEHIFLSIANERNTPAGKILLENGVTKDRIQDAIKEIRGGQHVTDPRAESRYRLLEKYSRDLSQMARAGKL